MQQVENLKVIIRIFPPWSSSIFLGTPIAILLSHYISSSNHGPYRNIGQNFKIPAGSIPVLVLFSTSVFLILIDRLLFPMWQKCTHQYPTPLCRIGVEHVLNVLGMIVLAFVESKGLEIAHSHNVQAMSGSDTVPIKAWWLFPQLVLVGIGEAFHFPGQVALYYQEFPLPLKSTGTTLISLIIGTGFYLSTALIDLLRRILSWLPDYINNGRLDNVFWILVVVGVLNFGYYLVCSSLYKYQNVEKEVEDVCISDR